MKSYALYLHSQISDPTLESPEQARRRQMLRELELQRREQRAKRRRERVNRARAFVAARRRHGSELAGRVG